MLRLRMTVHVFLIGVVMAMSAVGVRSQAYPNKPIRILTADAGGATDLAARLITKGISAPLGQQVVVDNRNSIVSGEIVAKAPSDGYTLLVQSSAIWVIPLLQSTPYDPVRDFAPITLTDRTPNILVVNPAVAAQSVRELVALAKARPGELNYGTAGSGTANHLAAELFRIMANINIVHIPYRGTAQSLVDLIGGRVHMMIGNGGAILPYVKSGKLRALAVTSAQPSELYPGLPPVATSGVPGYESVSVHAVFAPAKTPAAILQRLQREIARDLGTAETRERFLKAGLEVVGTTPQELAVMMQSEIGRLSKVIKETGIRGE